MVHERGPQNASIHADESLVLCNARKLSGIRADAVEDFGDPLRVSLGTNESLWV